MSNNVKKTSTVRTSTSQRPVLTPPSSGASVAPSRKSAAHPKTTKKTATLSSAASTATAATATSKTKKHSTARKSQSVRGGKENTSPSRAREFSSSRSPSRRQRSVSVASAQSVATLGGGVGTRFEPSQYRVGFNLQGAYSCMEVAPSSAALWAFNTQTGRLEIFNCVTGKLTTDIQCGALSSKATAASGSAVRDAYGARSPAHGAVSADADSHSVTIAMSPVSAGGPNFTDKTIVSALKAVKSHMWVGFDNGTVAVYDHLLLQFLTGGRFHSAAVTNFDALPDCTVVSASVEGSVVHWDREALMFEAIKRFPYDRDATLLPEDRTLTKVCASKSSNHTVFCGFQKGTVAQLNVESGEVMFKVRQHTAPVTDLCVVRDVLFSTSEDQTVLVWSNRADEGGSAVGLRVVKRISVTPAVRALLAEDLTTSIWVAYADGLLERWSASADDDFGVEEIVRDGMRVVPPEGQFSVTTGAASSSIDGATGPAAPGETIRLLSFGSVETMQILALSSNGQNKVWYGHRNMLEAELIGSVNTLNDVIAADTENVAEWRERANLLKQKEAERKAKYVLILEQLSEQRTLLRFFEKWRRTLSLRFSYRSSAALAEHLERRAQHSLQLRYFSKWASFYDQQQQHYRRYVLSLSMSESSQKIQMISVLRRWQTFVAKKTQAKVTASYVAAMEHASTLLLLHRYFSTWRHFHLLPRKRRGETAIGEANTTRTSAAAVVSQEQLQLLFDKSSKQVLRRALHGWLTLHESKRAAVQCSAAYTNSAAAANTGKHRFAALYADVLSRKVLRERFRQWRAWLPRRQRINSLTSVAALQSRQRVYDVQHRYLFKWQVAMWDHRLERQRNELSRLEHKLRAAEGLKGDAFDRLKLQKQLDELLSAQQNEEVQLNIARQRLADLEALLTETTRAEHLASSGSASPLLNARLVPQQPSSEGHMTTNVTFYRQLVEQQRLNPAILAQMGLDDGIHHVMAQFKGHLLNLFTDIALFRGIKDKRKGGATAAAIFLEAFGEVKRLVVSTVRGPLRAGGRLARWPLCMEALDAIPSHHCAKVLASIKTMIIAYDLFTVEDNRSASGTLEECLVNADWLFLMAKSCYCRRKPLLPANNLK